jgi:hypothetical protein
MRSLESACRLVRSCFNRDGLFIQFPTTEFGFIASQDPCEAERLNGAFVDNMLDGATTDFENEPRFAGWMTHNSPKWQAKTLCYAIERFVIPGLRQKLYDVVSTTAPAHPLEKLSTLTLLQRLTKAFFFFLLHQLTIVHISRFTALIHHLKSWAK